jgi:hypothetical protein
MSLEAGGSDRLPSLLSDLNFCPTRKALARCLTREAHPARKRRFDFLFSFMERS